VGAADARPMTAKAEAAVVRKCILNVADEEESRELMEREIGDAMMIRDVRCEMLEIDADADADAEADDKIRDDEILDLPLYLRGQQPRGRITAPRGRVLMSPSESDAIFLESAAELPRVTASYSQPPSAAPWGNAVSPTEYSSALAYGVDRDRRAEGETTGLNLGPSWHD
jgi:hypothetical protein